MIYNIVNIIISRQVVRNRFVAMVHYTTMLVIWKEPGSWKMNYNRTKLFNSSKVQLELITLISIILLLTSFNSSKVQLERQRARRVLSLLVVSIPVRYN